MTHRYLEAVATKALIKIRTHPGRDASAVRLQPGVEVDAGGLGDAVDAVRTAPEGFQNLVDRAHARLLEVATWDVRAGQIVAACRRTVDA